MSLSITPHTPSTQESSKQWDANFIDHGNKTNATDYYNVDSYDSHFYNDYPAFYFSHYFHIYQFEVAMYGYFWPALVLMVSGANILVVLGFFRKKMKNPIYLLLISVAVSDSMTGLVTLPAMFHVYFQENVLLTKEWCNGFMISRFYISRAFHTISIWQSLLLVIYRYLFICRPLMFRRFCNMRNTFVSIVVIYMCGFLIHIYHTLHIKAADDGFCRWAIEEPCIQTCVYFWLSLFFVHLMPSFSSLFITILIVVGINKVYTNFTGSNLMTSSSENQMHRTLTKVVVIISIIWLIPEIPYGIYYLIVVGKIHDGKQIFPLEVNRKIHLSYDVLVLISFHCNFWVYVLMMHKFRTSLKNLFQFMTCCKAQLSESSDTSSSTDQANDIELQGVISPHHSVTTNAENTSNLQF